MNPKTFSPKVGASRARAAKRDWIDVCVRRRRAQKGSADGHMPGYTGYVPSAHDGCVRARVREGGEIVNGWGAGPIRRRARRAAWGSQRARWVASRGCGGTSTGATAGARSSSTSRTTRRRSCEAAAWS
jgi:hypothetical protein